MKREFTRVFLFLFVSGIFGLLHAQDDDLLDMSFEDLMNMEITSVSKKAERLQDVPSSIYVITNDDIQRSSAQNLMQLLRDNVPGYWAVANDYRNVDSYMRNTAEGSILILLDGTPLLDINSFDFDLESFDIPFEQIDRIEVIKGSGGTVYGANSATGVISIISKNPSEQNALFISADYASPGQVKLDVIGTPIRGNKLAATVYGKYTAFSGFQQMDVIENNESLVPKQYGEGDTLIQNRYTGDDKSFSSLNLGLNLTYDVSARLKLSAGLNYVGVTADKYFQAFPTEKATFLLGGKPYAGDTVWLASNNKMRLTSNLKADYSFSENHWLFVRVSSNMEDKTYYMGGTYTADNNILDFEVQDNLDIGINSLSFGANYRMVNYGIETKETSSIRFVDPESEESLVGFFVQDKLSFVDDKLDIYLGVKGENFSLINDEFYFSPMAKFAYKPSNTFTVWGGFTQSYTTPGFNQTNIELDLFSVASPHPFYNSIDPSGTLAGTYDFLTADPTAGGAGLSHEEATVGIAQSLGDDGEAVAAVTVPYPETYKISAINGPKTVPTSFQNYELGFKAQPSNSFTFEVNYFYSIMEDGVGNTPNSAGVVPSRTLENQNIDAYYYGNYFKGVNQGIESVLKIKPESNFMVELSHAWFAYDLEYQENEDFDIADLTPSQNELKDDEYPQIPEHIFRWKIYYDLDPGFRLTLTGMQTTAFFTRFGSVESTYSYESQRYDPLYGDGGNQELIGGKQTSRTVMNFRIDKFLMDDKIKVFVFGNDFLHARPFVEGNNQLETAYPRQIGAMFGVGVTYSMQ